MKCVSISAILSVLAFLGAGCIPGNGDSSEPTTFAGPTAVVEADAAFTAWFEEQCPNGMSVQRTDRKTGEQRVVPCEEARATVIENEEARERLVEMYEQSLHQPHALESGESIGEARQSWSLFGIACSLVTTGLGLAFNWPGSRTGCNDPRASNPDACAKVTTFGATVLGIVCWFL